MLSGAGDSDDEGYRGGSTAFPFVRGSRGFVQAFWSTDALYGVRPAESSYTALRYTGWW
jgi:hypothetical protein